MNQDLMAWRGQVADPCLMVRRDRPDQARGIGAVERDGPLGA